MSNKLDAYATEEESMAVLQPDTRSNAQRKLDKMLDDCGAFEQGSEPFKVLYAIAIKLLEGKR